MTCSCKKTEDRKQRVTLTFKRQELLYDIGNIGYIQHDIMPEDTEHIRHQTADVVEQGNVDRVTRILNLAYTECVELLYPYTKRDIPESAKELDDILKEPDTYQVIMDVPEHFSVTTIDLLENLIHEFLVCRALAGWMAIIGNDSANYWIQKADGEKDKIRSTLTVGMAKITRRKLKPW